MYIIEYDETKKIDENAPYFVKECYNIKSITIDIKDFRNLLYDEPININVYSIYKKVKKVVNYSKKTNPSFNINKVTILNETRMDSRIIYEIINCEYMINKNETKEEIETRINKLESKLDKLYEKYDNEENIVLKNRIKKDIGFIEYFIDSIRQTNETIEGKVLRI